MARNRRGAPVVITRKDKRLGKGRHLIAFALTGGASGVYTAAKATTNAGYNARTRALQAASEPSEPVGRSPRISQPYTAEEITDAQRTADGGRAALTAGDIAKVQAALDAGAAAAVKPVSAPPGFRPCPYFDAEKDERR
jgi:hypothetical protein